jgi:hypothetical protein
MKHEPAQLLDRPTFSTAARDILSGRLPLHGTLTARQRDEAKTDCAIVAIDPGLPGCLAIVVLRKGRIWLVGSFQTETPIFWGDEPADIKITDEPPIEELLRRIKAGLSSGQLGTVVTLDDPAVARTFVEAFTQDQQAA